jgi:hypothetical protein
MYLATKQIQYKHKGEGGPVGGKHSGREGCTQVSVAAAEGMHTWAHHPSTPEHTHIGKTTLGIMPGGPTTKLTILNLVIG